MNHVIIATPGKCGASLLMRILTELGMDTGFPKKDMVDYGGNFEWPLRGKRKKEPIPYIIKEPQMCTDIDLRIEKMKWDIDHIYILLRRPGPVAPALEFIRRAKGNRLTWEKEITANDLDKVERGISLRIMQVVHLVAEMGFPHTLLSYPKYAAEFSYAYRSLSFLMERHNISYEEYADAAGRLIDQKQVCDAYAAVPEWNRSYMREKYVFGGQL